MKCPRMEDRSTDEVLCQLEQVEKKLREDGVTNTMVGSLDVVSLYPSLDQEGSALAVEKFVMECGVQTAGIDYRAAQVFLCSNLDETQVKAEGLTSILPGCLKTRGNRPGPTTTELGLKRPPPDSCDPRPPSKWAEMNTDNLTKQEKLVLIAKVCKVATRNVFLHHQYRFNGKTYRQGGGAPIGLRFTSVVARIIMDQWCLKFISKVVEAGMDLRMIAKYVDDINLVVLMLDLGSRWVADKVVTTREWEQEDMEAGRTRESVTMECVREAASLIQPWLLFTADHPGLHESGMVPCLDSTVV